jgi:hypothetical protein
MVVKDTDGSVKMAEYARAADGRTGVRLTPVEDWVRHHAAAGQAIYAATPEGMADPAALAAAGAQATAHAGMRDTQADTMVAQAPGAR